MTTQKIINGLNILLKYYDNPDGYHIQAEHDAIYVESTSRVLSIEDLQQMVEMGWFQESVDYNCDAGFVASDYDPEEGWTAYV